MREFARELLAVAVAALLYYLVRGAVSDRAAEAFQRARDILDLEARLWLDWELAIHEPILGSATLIDIANGTYFWGHMPLLIVVALWLWRTDRAIWRRLRNALLISAAAGMISGAMRTAARLPSCWSRASPNCSTTDSRACQSSAMLRLRSSCLSSRP